MTSARTAPPKDPPVPSDPLGILLLSGDHDRAHYAFVVASGAAAIGRQVVLFASNKGCLALCRDWSGLTDANRDARIQANGVAGLETLRDACQEMDVRMIACEAGRHPLAPLHPAARAGLIEIARGLDPLVLRWGK